MATYRCLACQGMWIDPQAGGLRYWHACPPLVDPDTGLMSLRPGHRDENIVQDTPGGPARPLHVGRGRELVSTQDVLTRAAPRDIPRLQALPAIGPSPAPEPEEGGGGEIGKRGGTA